MEKKIYFKIFGVILSTLLTTGCIHKQPFHDPKVNDANQREPSSSNEKIQIVDTNVKTAETAKYVEFDIQHNLTELENHIRLLLQQSNNEKKTEPKQKKALTMSEAIKFNAVDKGYRAGLKNILEQINVIKKASTDSEKNNAIYKIQLISKTLQNKYIPPIKTSFEATLVPIYILKYNYNQRIDKETVGPDSRLNPENSLLWTNQISKISALNLFSYRFKKIETSICEYEKAKSGWGVHPGFHIDCGDESYKLKFGNEVYSGPLNSRIYLALGYQSPEINYAQSVNVKYDRRMFTEFNSRKTATFTVTVLGQKAFASSQKYSSDLFDSAYEFVLTNGQHISSKEIKKTLLNTDINGRPPVDADFNASIESTIDYVTFKGVTITTKTDETEIGPWKVDDLDFTKKREFRGLMVLSAWLGNFDVRMDNNRLIQTADENKISQLKLALVDVGSGLGNSNSVLFKSSSALNEMSWAVTQTYKDGGGEVEAKDRLQMVGYLTLELNKTFEQVQLSDAQWMLRQMCQISKPQLEQALVAAGLSSAGVKLAEAKLLNRRNKMIEDFEMQPELQSSCYSPVDKKFNFDPKLDGLVEISSATGEKIIAPDRNDIVKNGILVSK